MINEREAKKKETKEWIPLPQGWWCVFVCVSGGGGGGGGVLSIFLGGGGGRRERRRTLIFLAT